MHIFKVVRFWHLLEQICKIGWILGWFLEAKSTKNREKIAFKTNAFWDVVFKVILGGFGRGFGRVWGAFGRACWHFCSNILRHVNDFDENFDFKGILEGSGEAFGTVLGGFGEAFGRVWESLGRSWPL